MGDRKIAQPLDDWNVVVGSCPQGDQGEKVKGQSSVRRKVPSSGAFLNERGHRLRLMALSRAGSRPGGRWVRTGGRAKELGQGIAILPEDCRNYEVKAVALGQLASSLT